MIKSDARNSERDAPQGHVRIASPAITVGELRKRYGSTPAVHNLSFEVPCGKVTGFLGPNGAGKTTTLRAVLGLIRPTSGSTTILGSSYRDLDHPSRRVGALLETQQFHPLRTGRNHLRVYAAASGIEELRVNEVLEQVDLSAAADRKVGGYSLGMRQRLGLATALLGDPDVLVLDEPANGLDPSGIRWLREFLRDFAHHERAVLVSSHLLAEMSVLADEVVVINKGRLVVHTEVQKLTAGAASMVKARTPEPERLSRVLTAEGMQPAITAWDEVVLHDAAVERVGAVAAREGIVLHGLDVEAQSLEEVFFELTQQQEVNREANS